LSVLLPLRTTRKTEGAKKRIHIYSCKHQFKNDIIHFTWNLLFGKTLRNLPFKKTSTTYVSILSNFQTILYILK
jgi:hypothetical protein